MKFHNFNVGLTLIYYYPSFGKDFFRLSKLLIIIDVDEGRSLNQYFTDAIYHLLDKFTDLLNISNGRGKGRL